MCVGASASEWAAARIRGITDLFGSNSGERCSGDSTNCRKFSHSSDQPSDQHSADHGGSGSHDRSWNVIG
jgi:hypothetical protein